MFAINCLQLDRQEATSTSYKYADNPIYGATR